MRVLPQRQSLAVQTAAILRSEIEKRLWHEWLPSERTLCEELQISRNTLRSALRQLARQRVIRSEHGAGNRILGQTGAHPPPGRTRDVGLISPEPPEQLRPTQALWIDELRAMLGDRECRLHLFHGRQFFRANPGPALRRLVAQHLHGCWILTLSNEAIQRWFAANGVPCVVAGSVHAGLDLPSRDLDHRALCRHAAGVLLGLGHRRIALVIPQSRLAGDLESEAGFGDGVRLSSHPKAEAVVCRHDGTVPGISQALRRLLERRNPPTALLVANAYHYLTVVGRLAQLGWRVPQEISVISRDEDTFLSFVVPAPARYVANPGAFARALLNPVLELLGDRPATRPTLRLMPKFNRGESVAAPTPAIR